MNYPEYSKSENKTFNEMLQELTAAGSGFSDTISSLSKHFPFLTYACIESRVKRYRRAVRDNQIALSNMKPVITKEKDSQEPEQMNYPITRSVEYKQDGSAVFDRIISLAAGEELTPAKAMQAHGMDPTLWEVLSLKSNFYQQQKKGGTILNLYQSKISVKPTKDISFDAIKEKFNELQTTFKPLKDRPIRRNGKFLYEINIADLHLGKFGDVDETGEVLNSDVIMRRFYDVINAEYNRIKLLGDDVEKILFVWTNDFFNSDGIAATTTGGTPQDTDMKWQTLFNTGVEMLITAIDKLSELAPVKTFYIASNHSRQTDYYAMCTLKAWFRNYPNVEIDTNCSPRYYERFGNVLLGFAHSYYEKKTNLPYLMSVECAEDWGKTTYREFHLAHIHTEQVEEKGGVIFRWLPTITGTDSWTKECGFVGSVKRSYSFVYDKELGLYQMNCTIVR